ncbi:hypothetical protein KP509_12G046500 [Ceratopteris richardii]|uniref:PRA1 family protein n=1 Tax=Ceratopteris richardii TaxID=49495 RepID=A0A8T2TLE7_CERRI|nr:hypothetical protein KP509_12G046500 [Ceratopteris richardii]
MDWSSVTLQELADAVKEADWWSPPRPLSEFFGIFSFPKSFSAFNSRLKCNLFVYRINYFFILVCFLLLFTGAVRSSVAFLGTILMVLAITCINDSFAMSVNEKVLKCARRIYPPLAAKLRATPTSAGRAGPSKGTLHICGKERTHVVLGMVSVSVLSWLITGLIKTLSFGVCLIFIGILLHATFRVPNLKARLNTFREEFRAIWRSYSDI